MKYIFIILLFFLALSKAVPSREFSEVVNLELIKGWRETNGVHYGGLKIKLSSGWKTYWKNPGETGFSPIFDWAGSQNLSTVKVLWPSPNIFDDDGFLTFGYDESVILPIEFLPVDISKSIGLKLNIELGICEKICVPISRSLMTKLRATKTKTDYEIVKYLNLVPKQISKQELKNIECNFESDGKDLIFRSHIEFSDSDVKFEAATVELPNSELSFELPILEKTPKSLRVLVRLNNFEQGPIVVNRSEVIINLLRKNESVFIKGC